MKKSIYCILLITLGMLFFGINASFGQGPCDTDQYCPQEYRIFNQQGQLTDCRDGQGNNMREYPTGNYGCPFGDPFKGVQAYSRGNWAGKSIGKFDYQCVALIKRFYSEAMGVNLNNSIGVARNYYEKFNDYSYLRNRGLIRIANNYSGQISVGDIVVFGGGSYGTTGHVAVVKEVDERNEKLYILEQNYSPTEPVRPLTLLTQSNNHKIDDKHKVLGWLHLPIGEFADGWHFDSDIEGYSNLYNLNSRPFVTSYENNGGRDTFGECLGKVHQFPDGWNPYAPYLNMRKAWIQEFEKNGYYYTLVINEYVLNVDQWYLGVAYPISGQIRTYWKNNYWELGYPVTNEYNYTGDNKNYVVQWFERLEEDYIVVIYNLSNGQIWHESDHDTCVPKENFNQHKEKNCVYDYEGIGGGESGPEPDPNPNPGVACNKEIGFTPEGFTRMDQVCYRQPFYNNYPIRETAMEYVDEGQNPADIMYSGNPTGYSLMPDAIPVLDQTGMKVIFEDDFNDDVIDPEKWDSWGGMYRNLRLEI
ncbi:MAG: CHAP domain-containing protein [Patescibacteria group bacterium]